METTFTEEITLIKISCDECSGIFAISKSWYRRKREEGGSWFCPYCRTGWHAAESECNKLKRQLEQAENKLASERARHDQTKMSLCVQKGENTKLKNRIKKGVCPCCHRYFKNLHRHMVGQHPDYKS